MIAIAEELEVRAAEIRKSPREQRRPDCYF
jgi:hypothetical protein